MPILEIEIVGGEEPRPTLAREIADGAATVLRSPPQGTWVRVRRLPAEDYAENGGAPAGPPPVFVHVLRRDLPDADALARETLELAGVVAAACVRPLERVHVVNEPAGRGRVAFGGMLVR